MRRTPIHVLLLVAAMAAALTGCSQLPTAPNTQVGLAPGSASALLGEIDSPPPAEQQGNSGLTTVKFAAGKAGSMKAGRFTLLLKAGSLRMPATISMVQPDPNVMAVQIMVSPAAANNFKDTVKLVADCTFDTDAHVKKETMFWLKAGWQPASFSGAVANDGNKITAETRQLSNAKVDLK